MLACKYKILIIIIAFCFCLKMYSQDTNKQTLKNYKEKTYLGFNMWIDNSTPNFYELSPYIMFQAFKHVSIGLSGVYIYHYNSAPKFQKGTNIFGARLFTDVYLVRKFENVFKIKSKAGFFLHFEYENILVSNGFFTNYGNFKGNYNCNSLIIGPSFNQPFAKRSNFQILVLFNLNYNNTYPYNNPMIRFGFNF